MYILEEIVSPGYNIVRGEFENPVEAKRAAVELFVLDGVMEENIRIKEVPL